ncbi:MAG: hypothetical protein EZS28_004258 [Streblomastix strix]|uniref:Calponin-homology (CH) domain-containing protein n=1 Tax=Streblomastix strix TaxID=222440 RepID=A0A5J4WZ03_9EUKA|nr:MAG: hypothetical protein EZS28_004258 [Streblomastix strix]
MENLSQTPIKGNSQVLDQAHLLISIERKVHQLIEAELCENLDVSLSDAARNGTLIELINAVCPGKHVEYKKKPTAHFAKVDNISALNEAAQKKFNIPFEDLIEPLCHVDSLLQVQIAQLMWHLMVIMDKRGYLQVDIYNEQYCSNPTDEDINRAICIIQTAQNARQLQKKGPIILVLDGIH